MPEITAQPASESGSMTPELIETDATATEATKSDEELVGLEPEAYRAEYKGPNDRAAETKEDSQAAQEQSAASTEPDEITPGQLLPESLKNAIAANPEIKAELLRLWEQHQAFREVFPTVAEARAVKELFPGGAEQAKTVLSKATEMERSDAMFLSQDARAQRELAASMLELDPQAFGAMLQASAELVRERNPQLYQAFVSGLPSQAPPETNFSEQLAKIARALKNNDTHSLRQLASELVQGARESGTMGGSRTPTVSGARTPHEELLERELNSINQQQAISFVNSINQSALPQIDAEIRKLIEPAAKGLPAYAREGATQSLAQQIHAGIIQRLKSDHHYHNQLASINQNYGAQNYDAATKAMVSRALLHLKPVAKQVLQAWTPRQIEQGRQTAEKAESAARRTDISGGGLTYGKPHAKLTKDEARDMTDDQLIDWALRR